MLLLEKKKQAKDKRIITKKANLKIRLHHLFSLPTQINNKLLHKVAAA